MARKKTATKQRSLAPQVSSDIPAGYTEIASAQVPVNDWEKNPILEGEVVSIKTVTIKRKEQRIMAVRRDDGVVRAVWCSKALEDLFDQVKPGYRIYIKFDGRKKLKGGQSFLQYRAAFKK